MFSRLFCTIFCVVFFTTDTHGSIHKHYDHFQRSNKYVEGVEDAVEYFTEFGYIDPTTMKNTTQSMSMEDIRDVIMDFQQVCSLNQTGRLDEPTMRLINTPRCGNKDVVVHRHHHGQPSRSSSGSRTGSSGSRSERYVLFGSKWQTSVLTYKITQYSRQSISSVMIATQIRRAFQIWENEINLMFIESNAEKVDIEVQFQTQEHGDNFPFEGTFTMAHAFYPGSGLGGDVHFNDEVQWSDPITLLYTAVHEIGHSLGLRHSTFQDSIMFAHYMFTGTEVKLHSDDIAGAQELYGSKSVHRQPIPTTTTTTTRAPTRTFINSAPWPRPMPITTTTARTNIPTYSRSNERPIVVHRRPEWSWPNRFPAITHATTVATRPPSPTHSPRRIPVITSTTPRATPTTTNVYTYTNAMNPFAFVPPTKEEAEEFFWERRNSEFCQNGIVDAVLDLHNGTIFVLRKDLILPLYIVNGKLIAGKIQPIRGVFKGFIPIDIDAAFTRSTNDRSYYFKDDEYWRATGTQIDDGYPKLISEHFPGIPNKLDAAFEWSNNQMYFFKGDEYWRFNTKTKPQVDSNYPNKINEKNWEGVPTYNVDAVFRLVGDIQDKQQQSRNSPPAGHSYFFRSGRYWRFDDQTGKVPTTEPSYPRDARVWFFGCTGLDTDISTL